MEQQPAAVAAPTLRTRASRALRRRHNWEQLAKFCAVGVSGYVVNLGVYALLLNWANLRQPPFLHCSFEVGRQFGSP